MLKKIVFIISCLFLLSVLSPVVHGDQLTPEDFRKHFELLSSNEKAVISSYYGLSGEARSFSQIAKKLEKSEESILEDYTSAFFKVTAAKERIILGNSIEEFTNRFPGAFTAVEKAAFLNWKNSDKHDPIVRTYFFKILQLIQEFSDLESEKKFIAKHSNRFTEGEIAAKLFSMSRNLDGSPRQLKEFTKNFKQSKGTYLNWLNSYEIQKLILPLRLKREGEVTQKVRLAFLKGVINETEYETVLMSLKIETGYAETITRYLIRREKKGFSAADARDFLDKVFRKLGLKDPRFLELDIAQAVVSNYPEYFDKQDKEKLLSSDARERRIIKNQALLAYLRISEYEKERADFIKYFGFLAPGEQKIVDAKFQISPSGQNKLVNSESLAEKLGITISTFKSSLSDAREKIALFKMFGLGSSALSDQRLERLGRRGSTVDLKEGVRKGISEMVKPLDTATPAIPTEKIIERALEEIDKFSKLESPVKLGPELNIQDFIKKLPKKR